LPAAGAKLAAFFRPGPEDQELEDGVPQPFAPRPRSAIYLQRYLF